MPIVDGWIVHEVVRGDTLSGIAKKYDTSPEALWIGEKNERLRREGRNPDELDYEDDPKKPPKLVYVRKAVDIPRDQPTLVSSPHQATFS